MLDTKNNIIPLLKDVCIFGGGYFDYIEAHYPMRFSKLADYDADF